MKQRKPKTKKSRDFIYYGCGFLSLLFFVWFWYTSNEDITLSELRTIEGQLAAELVKKSHGGSKKSYSFEFNLIGQPTTFAIKSNPYSIFNFESFKENESIASKLTLQVFKEHQNDKWEVVTLSTKQRDYITLRQINDARETDNTISYLFLIIGIACLIAGIRGK
ncbi:hypothetical protein [Reichenbachiella sp. MSK19-1]|uniref:hypothetical protein n=1 Tax=Reichenbachiella sp. MSK19-1 TaxID=1897631 RepID=UPI0011C462B8|nr:hypothetical protein [Reichenbachiella sp. MSK19-1]